MSHPPMAHGVWCHIEIPSKDIAKSKEFYGNVFGWTFQDYGPDYAGIQRPDGTESGGLVVDPQHESGRLVERQEMRDRPRAVVAVDAVRPGGSGRARSDPRRPVDDVAHEPLAPRSVDPRQPQDRRTPLARDRLALQECGAGGPRRLRDPSVLTRVFCTRNMCATW